MLVLTATRAGQDRDDDFCWTLEGEPVLLSEPCDRDLIAREQGGGGCGCARAFSGMGTMVSTTTAIVTESALTRSELFSALHGSLVMAGCVGEELEPEQVIEVEEELTWLLELAAEHEVGTILERDFDEIRVRSI